MDIHIDNVPHIVTACCVLHNFCEVHGDSFDEDWLQENADLDNTGTNSSSDDHHYGSSNREGVYSYKEHVGRIFVIMKLL